MKAGIVGFWLNNCFGKERRKDTNAEEKIIIPNIITKYI